ncbi:uncharacterized protein LOC112637048 [Camponotus floridanus]|uniref:uncharacterized protein LOC112637048 n=1 Tax=Camponotus floridanus TaxID=104421 RepID=UPI000DC67C05|nr:uncharacterized protein LOC112637048 [Camponotus floridanus]
MMKVLMLVAYVLIIATVVYTLDTQTERNKFFKDFTTCADELNSSRDFNRHVIKCMFEKNFLVDEQGRMKKDEILRYFGYITSSQEELQKIASCIDHELDNRNEESNDKKTLAAIDCFLFKLSIITRHF